MIEITGNNFIQSKIYVNEQYKIENIYIESWGKNQYEKTYRYKNFPLKDFNYLFLERLIRKLQKE